MSRPRKPEMEQLEDRFYDSSLAEQVAILDRLQLLHRLKARQKKPEPAAVVTERTVAKATDQGS